MRAFQVGLNGKRLCLAGIGIGNDGVLSCIVNWVARAGKGDLFLQVGVSSGRPRSTSAGLGKGVFEWATVSKSR
jgi:hypothetical protein